ncbi:MAG: glycosyltransferase [Bacteroidetes bacterium]|nr:glycosyltransferase [Bacteroidota bacterium]
MKIVAIVVLYNPNIEIIKRNINSYLPWIDHLIVWENTPEEKSVLRDIETLSVKIELRSNGRNDYLASPFNHCIQWARENDYDYILTMDQDSCFEANHFAKYRDRVASCNDNSVAIFAPSTNRCLVQNSTTIYVEQGSVYSSGAIYKRQLFDCIGGFRDDLAIYCLDTEICMRARKHGYRIVMFPNVFMEHSEGYKTKGILGITINNYSAQSTYFYIRNNLLLWKIYPHDFTLRTKFNFLKYHVVYRMLKMVFEQDRISKLKAVASGLWNGIKTAV